MVGDSTTYWDLLIDGVPHIFGKPRLYTNDGTGVFTEVGAPGWDPMVSDGTHDVAFVDIDNDWDVDVLLTDVSPSKGHYLMVNDGAGGFVDQAGLLPVVSSNAWETEVADLDGDQDMDLYVVGLEVGPPSASWAGTSGPVRNLTNPIGSLGFVKVPGPGDTDINEAVLIDYDVDGDLDAFIAGLGVPDDQVHRNDGPAGFALVPGILPPGLDPENPTLDSTCADLDNDGDLDYLAVQGEYPGADWTNHLYLNSGPADTLQPVVQREELLGASVPLAGPWVVRTQVGDQVMDDGHDGLFASATLRVTDVFGAVHTTSIDGVSIASALDRFELTDPTGGLGTDLQYELTFVDRNGNTTVTPTRSATLAGLAAYGEAAGGANVLGLSGTGDATPGGAITATVTGVGAPAALLVVSAAATDAPFLGGSLFVDLASQVLAPVLLPAAGGTASTMLPVPASAGFVGVHVFLQAAADDTTQPAGWALSNGLHVAIGG